MNKKIIIPIVVIVLIFIGLFWYAQNKRFDADNVSITYVANNKENEKSVINLKKDNLVIKINKGGDEQQRGITSSQREKFIEIVNRLYVKGKEPSSKSVCQKDETKEANSWIEIDDGKVSGITYFCEGFGVDEEGNIHGPIQDILRELQSIDRGQS